YSETWPTSGMTRSGEAYELPTSEPPTSASESSLLPTPDAYQSTRGGGQHPTIRRAGGHSVSLQDVALHLLPTPRATDGTKGGPNQRGSSGDLMLPSAVQLLPTPTTIHTPRTSAASKRKHGSGPGLLDAVDPTGTYTDQPSTDGRPSSADPPPLQLWPDSEAPES